ncbi:PI31 proteasome regulator N-terminal-domain-containing protein [Podospora aff. communis PSN243]|uniref:PI31 proteasome regulator N-terminal-domain-containing protein n=1 Tax=Podospora aff. communis PSN243 TaxID=3040156 RepID=A0AAV9GJE0_9PEZI|nr:PI31 proteasome regulator N-terminal-domain-containing protein [Podospora aff. communis PSN243]
MALNPLSPARIVERMAEALPTHDKDDTTSDLSSSLDVVALCIHASMANLDFKLVSLNEDDKTGSDCARLAPRLPPAWNASINSRNFVYSHTQSSMKFIIRLDRLGRKAEIRGLATGDDRIARFEITPDDYISKSNLPLRIPFTTQDDGATVEDRGEALASKLTSLFTHQASISDLAKAFKTSVIQKLAPSIFKEGYEEENPDDRAARQDAESSARSGARPPNPPYHPELPEPARPGAYPQPPGGFPVPAGVPTPAGDFPPPGFDDEYEINRPPRGAPFNPNPIMGGVHNPYGIGGSDLYPAGLGPDDPLRSSFVPGRMPGPGGSGGMHPTFDDPLFQGPRGQGVPNFDPQVPPGARWDPIGPGGAPRFGGGRPGGRGGGGFGGAFGGSGFGDII